MVIAKLAAALLAVLCSLGPSSPASAASSHQPPPGATAELTVLNAQLRQDVSSLASPGGAFAVVRNGTVVAAGGTGSGEDGQPFTAETPILLGSVSKPVLATVVVELARRRSVHLDTPVVNRLPELRRVKDAQTITARQLLNHTSGLPFGAKYLDVADADRTPVDVVKRLDPAILRSTPGERYGYSSLGYVVLAAWLEASMHQPLSATLAGTLPLRGLITDAAAARRIPAGKRDLVWPTMTGTYDGAGLGYGYTGGSAMTLADLAISTLKDRDQLTQMTSDVQPQPGQTLTGLGWRVTQDPSGLRRVWHTGTVPGYFTAIQLVPAENLAVVMVLNRSGFFDEQRLYDASANLLAVARGQQASPVGKPWAELGLLAGAILLSGVALAMRGRGRAGRVAAGVIGAHLLAAPVVATLAMGMPARYLWLWAPLLLTVCVAAGVVALAAAARGHGRKNPGRRVTAP